MDFNKYVNLDFKNLTYRLNAKKISLNVYSLLISPTNFLNSLARKYTDQEFNRKRLFSSKLLKYFGIKIDEN